jgi:hypothetical protein
VDYAHFARALARGLRPARASDERFPGTSAGVLAEELDRRQSYTSADFGERFFKNYSNEWRPASRSGARHHGALRPQARRMMRSRAAVPSAPAPTP